jgi:hypothetical protein
MSNVLTMKRDKMTSLMLPSSFHQELKGYCEANAVSFNGFIIRALVNELNRAKEDK